MRKELLPIVVFSLTLILLSQPCKALTISDGTFADSDWTHSVLRDDTIGGGIFTAGQVTLGGNPGSYQGGSHTWGPGLVNYAHIFSGVGMYDPALQGPITSLDFSHDFIVFSAQPIAGDVATALLLEQSGSFYVAPTPFFNFSSGQPWTSVSQSFIETDFMQLGPIGLIQNTPDLSATGAPIAFGYATLNSTSFTGRVTVWGMDNYELTIQTSSTPLPVPSTFLLLGTGLIGLLGYGWRQRRKKQAA